ncbi:MAG TPA: PKD domain-containing protein, partial [Candidatus Dormibacteraeota bacterium]
AQIDAGAPGSKFLVGFNQTVTTTVNVANGMGQATFSTTWPGSDVAMSLTSPSGRTVTRTTSSADVYHLLGPTYEVFTVSNPEPGTWTVNMLGANVSADGEIVRLNTTQLPHVNVPPIASFSQSAASGTAPLSITFDANGSSGVTGTLIGYSWDFGDGSIATGVTTSHTFTKPGTYSVRLTVTDDAGAQGFTASTVLVREPATLTYSGATSGDFNDPALIAATLTSSLTGHPIPGTQVNLTIAGSGGNQGCAATTDASGLASCLLTITLPSGSYTVSAASSQTDLVAAASTSAQFIVTVEEASLTYTGPQAVAAGKPQTFSAALVEDATTPISGRTLVFTLGSGGAAQTCSATTDQSGVAACSIAVAQALGPTPLSITFGSDGFYAAASANATVIVFAYVAGGSFVIGDRATDAGGSVTFWGANWKKANPLSGGTPPSDFLGFENSTALPVCGEGWNGEPGTSGGPPASLPAYIAVIVSSQVTRSGAILNGDTLHIVIVQVAPGYANYPGRAGTGTIVAVLC